jgi:Tfp pilus assembly protein PilV
MPTTNLHAKNKTGFSLIEIVLSLFFIIALATILFSASGTLLNSRSGNLETVASKIAAKQVENLRNTDFASLPGSGTFADTNLSQLPQGSATRTITNYQSSPDVKDVSITVAYTENGAPKQVKMETLIYKNGL